MVHDLADDLLDAPAHSVEDPVVGPFFCSPPFRAVACCACWKRAVDVTTELVLRVLYYTMAEPLVCWITWQ